MFFQIFFGFPADTEFSDELIKAVEQCNLRDFPAFSEHFKKDCFRNESC